MSVPISLPELGNLKNKQAQNMSYYLLDMWRFPLVKKYDLISPKFIT